MTSRLILMIGAAVSFVASSCSSTSTPADPTSDGTASGTISLVVSIDGMRTTGEGIVESKTVLASGDLQFNLTDAPVDVSADGRTVNWDEQKYTGSTYWSTDHLKTYECNGASVTDRELTVMTYNSGAGGGQPGGGMLHINPDGTYTLSVVALLSELTPGTSVNEVWGYCGQPTYVRRESPASIPFIQYFTPMTGGLTGSFTGTSTSAAPATIKGSWSGKDSLVVFSSGVENITIPIEYTVRWDLSFEK